MMGRPPKPFIIDGKEYTSAIVARIRKTSVEAARVACSRFKDGKMTKEQLLGPSPRDTARLLPGEPTAEWRALQDKRSGL